MDKKRSVVRRRRYQEKKALKRWERLAALESSLDKGFSGWEFSTPEKRRSGLVNLLEMALARLVIDDIETMTPCSDERCLDIAAMCFKLMKKDLRRQELL